jgi:hypothetical protein
VEHKLAALAMAYKKMTNKIISFEFVKTLAEEKRKKKQKKEGKKEGKPKKEREPRKKEGKKEAKAPAEVKA